MENDQLKLHIVVNDEIIDLRKENFEKRTIRTRIPHRTISQQLVSRSSRSININQEHLPVTSLKKLASNIYHGPNLLQKHKTNLRNKQRNRATSADPRFRRERSPILQKNAGFTQSDSDVVDPPMNVKKNKTQSDSTFILNPKQILTKTSILKPLAQITEPQCEPIRKLNTIPTHFVVDTLDELGNRRIVKKESVEKLSSFKRSSPSQNCSFETFSPSSVEQSTMTDEIGGMMDCKSIYQSAITDVCHKTPELEIFNTSINYDEEINPFWDDPRLIEKYANFIKPVQIKKSRSSWTLPLTATAKEIDHSIRVCPKCTCTNLVKDSYAYETSTNYTEASFSYEKTKSKIYDILFTNYYLTAFFLFGSFCGLALVALVVWVLANDLLWNYLNKSYDMPKQTGMKWALGYFGGGFLYGLNVIITKIYHMIIMPRNVLFEPLKNEASWSIF